MSVGPNDLKRLPACFEGLTDSALNPAWGSDRELYRQSLRTNLFSKFKDPALLDLKQFPKMTKPYVSISHTAGMGGWVAANHPIGFDIEVSDRAISGAIFKRLGSPAETSECPSPIHLWVAKEAAFKACWELEITRTISQIVVQNWLKIDQTGHTFSFNIIDNLAISGWGQIDQVGRFTMGIVSPNP